MKFESNIKSVLGRLRRFEKEAVPTAIHRTLAPTRWQARLEMVAEKTLRALIAVEPPATREALAPWIPRIVATLTIEFFSAEGSYGFQASMEVPNSDAPRADVEKAAEFALNTKTPSGRTSRNFRLPFEEMMRQSENLDHARHGILDWVRTEKIKTQIDAGLTDEEIAERLQWIMGLSPHSKPRERTRAMEAAGERLAGRIQEFLGERAASASLDPRKATAWLVAVLEAWKQFLQTALPAQLRTELERAMREIGETLL